MFHLKKNQITVLVIRKLFSVKDSQTCKHRFLWFGCQKNWKTAFTPKKSHVPATLYTALVNTYYSCFIFLTFTFHPHNH